MKDRVLVTNFNYKNALAVVDSLGRRGIPVSVCGPRERRFYDRFTSYSRYCDGWGFYSDPRLFPWDFVSDLCDLLLSTHSQVLFPIGVDTFIPVSYHKETLTKYAVIPVADYPVLKKTHDKSMTIEIANKIGVPTPRTIDITHDDPPYPVVIKRRRGSGTVSGIRLAYSKADVLLKYEELNRTPCDLFIEDYTFPLIQEYIPGEIRDVCTIFCDGEPRGALAQRRVLTYPPEGGVGIVNETIHDPDLIELALKLLKEIGWHGVAQVEFRLDREETPRLMEVNPKFWGTLELSIRAGIDFPLMLYTIATKEDVDAQFNYHKGVQLWWVSAHFPQILIAMIRKRNEFITAINNGSRKTTDFTPDTPHLIQLLRGLGLIPKLRNLMDTPYHRCEK